MNRLFFGLSLVVLGFGAGLSVPATASAQQDSASADPAGQPGKTDKKEDDGTANLQGAVTTETQAGDLGAATRRGWEDVVVVPRKGFLKDGRLELMPFAGVSLNDVLIRHYAFGGDLNYFLTDVFSVGLQGQYFIKERTYRSSLVGLQYNRVPTLNKYNWAGALNFGYVPGYGKFTLFNRYIAYWDLFISAGIGVIQTEIIPRFVEDAAFSGLRYTPNFGIGTRLVVADWLTFNVSLRDYAFFDKYEPTNRKRTDKDINKVIADAETRFVQNVMLYVGIGMYLPTSFQYKTPR